MFVIRQKRVDRRIAHDELSGNPPEQSGAEHDQDGHPVQDPQTIWLPNTINGMLITSPSAIRIALPCAAR
jgi:hypothetical protein